MIAPVSEPKPRRRRAPGPRTSARRAVAAVLLARMDPAQPPARRWTNYLSWSLFGSTMAITLAYLALLLWWTLHVH